MKPTHSQLYFLGGVVVWVGILQMVMLWYLGSTNTFICNSKGAWPLSNLPGLGTTFLTLLLTIVLGVWFWGLLRAPQSSTKLQTVFTGACSLLVATGLSHAIERATSECVLDYWHLSFSQYMLHFNLGDISLTLGTLLIIWYWWREHREQ